MLHVVLEHGFSTRPEQAQHKTAIENNKTNSCLFCLENSLRHKREVQIYFAGNMEDAGMSTKEERYPEQPLK